MADLTVVGFEISGPVLALGAITGMVYGVLGVGLVLVYRSSRTVNFAHGDIGAFGAAVLAKLVVDGAVPYWAAFVVAIGVAAAIGSASEMTVMRRLEHAPVLITVIATLALGQVLQILASMVSGSLGAGITFPQPPGLPSFDLGPLRVTQAHSAMLIVTPVVVSVLALFLSRSRMGLALRSAADNADAARMAGVLPTRMASLAWAAAGALAAFTAIVVLPTRGFSGGEFLGPGLLLRAMVCGVAARMTSLPIALGAGLLVGVVEALLLANYPGGGVVEVVLFAAILLGLLVQRVPFGRTADKGAFSVVRAWSPLPDSYRSVWLIGRGGWLLGGAALVVAAILPALLDNERVSVLIVIAVFALVGLSVGIVTALGGQLTLGQFALAGVGAATGHHVVSATGSFILGLAGAGVVAGLASVVIGLPALRIKGLMLAVSTLAFALAAQAWLLPQSWVLGSGVVTSRPEIAGTTLSSSKQYYFVALSVLVAGMLLARNTWTGGFGRRLRAVRDNEDAARSFAIRATSVKIQGFAVAGFIAGIAGSLYGHFLARLSPTAFPIEASVNAAAVVVIGGLGVLIGPILGALYIVGVPNFVPLDNAGLAALAAGWLILILRYPGGLAQALAPWRDRSVEALARRAGLEPPRSQSGPVGGTSVEFSASVTLPGRPTPSSHDVVLEARRISRAFGGVQAVDGVDLTVRSGETVGIMGTNGAGKTTLFEILSGFTSPDAGEVHFLGSDITHLPPELRSQAGLVRSFQDAALFPTLTVRETVMLSLERVDPTRLLPDLLGLRGAERRRGERATELLGMMGLHDYRDSQVRTLSTGTRRITELACLIAMEPVALLLDEPTSGIAQRETEAMSTVLTTIQERLGVTLLLIEHDVPLLMGLSDRVVAMEAGMVIAQGAPSEVATNARVVSSYLGTNVTAIERSGDRPGANGCRCRATTRAGTLCSRGARQDGLCVQHWEQHVD